MLCRHENEETQNLLQHKIKLKAQRNRNEIA